MLSPTAGALRKTVKWDGKTNQKVWTGKIAHNTKKECKQDTRDAQSLQVGICMNIHLTCVQRFRTRKERLVLKRHPVAGAWSLEKKGQVRCKNESENLDNENSTNFKKRMEASYTYCPHFATRDL